MNSLWIARRSFTSSPARLGLYKDFLAQVKPTVPAVAAKAFNAKMIEQPDRFWGDNVSIHIFDVREPYEWNEERLPYANYTGRGKLEGMIASESLVPDASADILLYCSNGNRSMLAAESLQQLGYKNVKFLSGGIGAWKKEHFGTHRNIREVV
ncbi:hypothetical protein HDU77_011038 [Chytriomyces hyalinus]|uniref:Rhodanese domain-containing protein n=1 Tax=Chytriomyces confervae TaxID=246404 RepID=A0A507EVC1_9FUNG|nr:hypothetical protein HDU77_011038 [Chytriomyces hyalinus]TPX67297.1 hypothetical protein CcCBS67573_g07546 [Chytriomyces confervae]